MRWDGQSAVKRVESDGVLPGLELAEVAAVPGHLRTVRSPEFRGAAFHEVLAKSALNRVPAASSMPFQWTVNPYRGCSHACVYCFARGSHRYLDFDAGRDFDSQIVVKVNVAEVLGRELARPSWKRETVALGTNTDPYQRAEGRYRLMPGIIDALSGSGTPLTILTKGSLLRRDLPRLAEAAERVPVHLAMSIAVGDPELQQALEPGTPSTRARLETVAAARAAGFDVDVFVMPVLPYLTDSTAALERLLRDIRDAGAASVTYGALHLRAHVKPWFLAWLERTHPELLGAYRSLYPGSATTAPQAYRLELASRIRPLIRRYGLERTGRSTRGARLVEPTADTGAPTVAPRGARRLPSTSGPVPSAAGRAPSSTGPVRPADPAVAPMLF
ncbi:Rv2578c family radical SAM protein [Leucobacter sp. CSA1]|uniref:Rv2578c family radical SAM protein n=1 Tax=Leucobacter chromiisoli TaxID=2796471 RepID=A0A934UTZ3_9MICO|nr:Rv2578c family radical SAM protein [Leucobacter chromiisoli]MBK0417437.1 Rv2578c family radical SAM protein [Leucobacter chromiisoli]